MRALRKTTELELGFLRIERANRIYLQGLTTCAQPPRNGQQVKYRYHLKEIYVYWKFWVTLDYEYDDILRSGFSIIQKEYNSGKKLDIKNRT